MAAYLTCLSLSSRAVFVGS